MIKKQEFVGRVDFSAAEPWAVQAAHGFFAGTASAHILGKAAIECGI